MNLSLTKPGDITTSDIPVTVFSMSAINKTVDTIEADNKIVDTIEVDTHTTNELIKIQQKIDQFDIKKIGNGTSATIYLVETDRNSYALKTSCDDESDGLSTEIELLKQLTHPGIIGFFGQVSSIDGDVMLVLDYAKGGDLFSLIAAETEAEKFNVRQMLMQILSAVEYLHGFGIIHRDLKPENIVIFEDPTTGKNTIKLIDFASVVHETHMIGNKLSRDGMTPQFSPPECLLELVCESAKAVDIWAVGVIFYMMVVKNYPFYCKSNTIDRKWRNFIKDSSQEVLTTISLFSTVVEDSTKDFSRPNISTLKEDELLALGQLMALSPLNRPSASVMLDQVSSWK